MMTKILKPTIIVTLAVTVVLAPLAALAQTTATNTSAAPTSCDTHTVVQGDTLAKIARRYGVTIQSLVTQNKISNPNIIHRGQILNISCTSSSHSTPQQVISHSILPRIMAVSSTGNGLVTVAFNESMQEDAVNPANYFVVQEGSAAGSGRLVIMSARFVDDAHTRVELTTQAQADVRYRLVVSGLRDSTEQPLGSEQTVDGDLPDSTSSGLGSVASLHRRVLTETGCHTDCAYFRGTARRPLPSSDADGDGLSDAAEQEGWEVLTVLSDGREKLYSATSDPDNVDTDRDGVLDSEEKAHGTDPRAVDTDGDLLTDYQELVEIYSNPLNQDSDGDGLQDDLEFNFFKTSPLLADSDGDQLTDFVEIHHLGRNPLIADLPRMQIFVGDARLSVNVLSSYVDETGSVAEKMQTLETTLGESRDQRFSTSDTTSTETTLTFGQTIGLEVGFDDGFSASGSFEATFGQSMVNGFTATTDRESAESSTRTYQDSVSHAFAESQNQTVTRRAEEAEIVVPVSIQNVGDIAFTIKNIELSVLQQDRRNANRFRPVAALRLEGATDPLSQPAFNLGPLDPERGPFIFKNSSIFPNLVEELLREPQGLIYRVANYDLVDELGRNFVFAQQDASDRTAKITIDYGDGLLFSIDITGDEHLADSPEVAAGADVACGDSRQALDQDKLFPELRQAFEVHGVILSEDSRIQVGQCGRQWTVNDAGELYRIQRDHQTLNVFYGQPKVESYRIATYNGFAATGTMQPITMQEALALVGIGQSVDPTGDTPGANPTDASIRSTYGTQRVGGVEVLTRVRGM